MLGVTHGAKHPEQVCACAEHYLHVVFCCWQSPRVLLVSTPCSKSLSELLFTCHSPSNSLFLLQGLAAIILGRRGSVVVLKVRKAGSSAVETVALERFESDEGKQEGRQDTQQGHSSYSATPMSAGRHHKGPLSESSATPSRGMETETALPVAHHDYLQELGPARAHGAFEAPRDRAPESILRRGAEQNLAVFHGGVLPPGNEAEAFQAVRHDPSLHPDSPSGSYRSDEVGGWEAAARDLGHGMQAGPRAGLPLTQVSQSHTQLAKSGPIVPSVDIGERTSALHGTSMVNGTGAISSGSGLPRETADAAYYGWREGEKHAPGPPGGSTVYGHSASNVRYGPPEPVRQAVPHGMSRVRDAEGPMQQRLPDATKAAPSAGSSLPPEVSPQVHHRRLSPPPPPPVSGGAEAVAYDVQGIVGNRQGGPGGRTYEDGDMDERCSLPRDPSLDRIQAPQSAASATHKGKISEKLFGLGVTFKVVTG
jgi:hypothetical protein